MINSSINKFLIILFSIFLSSYIFAADECGPSDYSVTLDSNNTTYTLTSDSSSAGKLFYINVAEPGNVDINLTTDNDMDFSYSLNSCPTNTGIEQNSASLNFASADDFNLMVFSGNAAVKAYTLSITFTPPSPPIMGDVPDQTADTGTFFNLDISSFVTATNGDAITAYTISTVPSGLSFNTSTGLLSGTPSFAGDYNISVTASDVDGVSNSDYFNISIAIGSATAVNDTYLTLYNETPAEYNISENVIDNDFGEGLSVIAWTVPSDGNFSMDSNGSFTYTPDVNFTGTVTFDYTIEDNETQTDTATVTMHVLTELPTFCYGYAYKQYGQEFTEENNGTQLPRLVGSGLSTTEDINITVYIRNQSNIRLNNVSSEVINIDNTQVTPVGPTTFLDESYWRPGEYFFTNYALNPVSSDVNTTIEFEITLLNMNDLTQRIYDDIPLCSGAGIGGNAYTAEDGLFNVVHNDYTNAALSTGYYNNIPTQVTKRAGNFTVIAIDENNTLSHVSTPVAVDIIDASYFNDTQASCNYEGSAISDRVWMQFDYNTSSFLFDSAEIEASLTPNNTITSSAEFYQNANDNAAFRLSFAVTDDGNDDLVQLSPPNAQDEQQILNFPEIVQVVGACQYPVKYPLGSGGNVGVATRVAQACGNAGNYISQRHIQACMECIYGFSTKVVCSKDNFAIRPEAILIKIDDQNQSDKTSQLRIADDISGVAVPSTDITHMAAGYDYNLEINATTNLDSRASSGYTANNIFEYIWEPRAGHTVTGCNDASNQPAVGNFIDGYINMEKSVGQVGEYRLHIEDTTWTTVDSSPGTHHTGAFFVGGADCVSGSTVTHPVNYSAAPPFIGCNISSSHTNDTTSIVYNDYNITFHPYKFDMTGVVPSHGENNSTAFDANTFIYMSDMSVDEEMSFHLNGQIKANGYYDSNLSNFVDDCYAVPVDLSINKTLADTNSSILDYQYRFYNTDIPANDKNGTVNGITEVIALATNDFNKSNNGIVNTRINLNFDRNITGFVNPEELLFSSYNSDCNTTADCTFSADLTSKTTQGVVDLNQTIKHYYGRAHATRQRYEGDTGEANIYYEVYCFDNIGGNSCEKSRLQQLNASTRTDDIRWYVNESHTLNEGSAKTVVEIDSIGKVAVTGSTTGIHPDKSGTMTYNESQGYPYKTTMVFSPSGWLIYNRDDINATRNQFSIEFQDPDSEWSGASETNTTTKDQDTATTNRRTTW